MKALLVSRSGNSLAQGQIYPFRKYRSELKKTLGFCFDEKMIGASDDPMSELGKINHRSYDLIFFQARALPKIGDPAIEYLKGISAKKIILDSSANIGGAFELLGFVDLYIKKQMYADVVNYGKPFWDGRLFSDYLIRYYSSKKAVKEEALCKSGCFALSLPPEAGEKLFLGWNTGTMESFEKRFAAQGYQAARSNRRAIDVSCRVRLTTPGAPLTPQWSKWYYDHRLDALERLRRLGTSRRVVAEGFLAKDKKTGRIPAVPDYVDASYCQEPLKPDAYWRELEQSAISVSPFGMAEICLRDFEAIIAGALLVKPRMDHLKTVPNIYRPMETYVPVEWDLSDLNDQCEYFLVHEDKRREISENAARVYADYFKQKHFLTQMKEVLRRSGLKEGL